MNHRRHDHPIPEAYREGEPFRMTELHHEPALSDIQEMTDSLEILASGRLQTPFRRSRFFSGVCLALPLSALLWYLLFVLW